MHFDIRRKFLLFVQTGLLGGIANAAPTEIDGGTVAAATPQWVGGKMRFATASA
jgi:hypothetical protein